MKSFIFSLLLLCSFSTNAEIVREGTTFKYEKKQDELMPFTFTDSNNVVYSVYRSANGKFYINRISANGKIYKYYFPKETQEEMSKYYEMVNS